jgi:hypothetical protein
MEKEVIQKFISSGDPANDLYAIKFKDFGNAVGYFDKYEALNNQTNVWKFYLNDDFVNKKYSKEIIEINGDDIYTLDRF